MAYTVKTLAKLSGNLVLCGPFEDNDGAVQVIRAESEKRARQIFEADPFILGDYVKTEGGSWQRVSAAVNNGEKQTVRTRLSLRERMG